MARKELVMSEHPFWQTVLQEGGCGPKVVEIEVTTKAEISGRTARKEISLYDAIHAEILGEKFAEKCRHEKHRAGKEYRHRKPEDRHAHGERYGMSFAKVECGNDHVRNLYHEITLRNDWELEQESIAEFAMWEQINFDVETERLKALEVWLEWA